MKLLDIGSVIYCKKSTTNIIDEDEIYVFVNLFYSKTKKTTQVTLSDMSGNKKINIDLEEFNKLTFNEYIQDRKIKECIKKFKSKLLKDSKISTKHKNYINLYIDGAFEPSNINNFPYRDLKGFFEINNKILSNMLSNIISDNDKEIINDILNYLEYMELEIITKKL
jgi:hypothetical protein